MLTALTSLFDVTQFILGSTIITAVLGVKQGSPTSCFLFILFVDEFIRLVKSTVDDDGFLKWLHMLMLMDDTVIFATSRERLCQKLDVLVQWCNKSGMVINEDKTQFMAIGAQACDKVPILLRLHHGLVKVKHCAEYKYLGAIITSDGKTSTSIAKHTSSKEKEMNKLTIFLQHNKNAPYAVKKVVVDACFNSSLLYGCESWLGVKPSGPLNAMYMKAIKMLLGVRQSSSNDTCLVEAGYPTLEALIRHRQKKFLESMINERQNIDGDPLMFALEMTEQENIVMHRHIQNLLTTPDNILETNISAVKERIMPSQKTKAITYRELNPDLSIHPVYTGKTIVDDDLRTSFTRLRLSSHRLRVETGRWSRIERADRLCQCGSDIQTEQHVLIDCDLVTDIRRAHGCDVIEWREFMTGDKTEQQLMMVKKILNFYENT